MRRNLETLFEILNTPEQNREPYLEDIFKNFPYVNGNLFADNIEIPNFDNETKNSLLDEAANFDWSGISPTIFGAVFESTLNPVTRREGGMHYTSVENIHKVIDNLFLNDLYDQFAKIKSATRNRKKLLLDFQNKLSQLKFFDPACGSGNFLPLKNFANIFEGNALTLDWKKICPQPNFIFGNPPFVSASMMTKQQKIDATNIFGNIKLSNSIDYVGAWYLKAANFIQGSKAKCAFVSTNSITQGEQVAPLWSKVLQSCYIIFAYRTFCWDSESNSKAHVHCVIIGFADKNFPADKFIFDGEQKIFAQNINAYLLDAPNILIYSRSKPISNVPKLTKGNQPTDDGNFIFSEHDAENFAKNTLNIKNFCTDI